MLFTEIIRKKRDGGELSAREIDLFVDGLASGSLPAEQVAALAMAICLRSMTFEETALLTTRMAASGKMLDWTADTAHGPVVDKHSTGGVGDKISLLLAPIAAACGCCVPMISGRGLGHTGGTLDKLESIPGYRVNPQREQFEAVVRGTGCAIIGQTADLAPADKRLYAIRDITGTIESIPLITASILSKKMAAGVHALVLDVKVGSGAFMSDIEQARALADSIVTTAGNVGLNTHALITDMNETLGTTVGNAVEVVEAVAYLTGAQRDPRVNDLTLTLAAHMMVLAGVESDLARARQRADDTLTSGRAAEVFGRMVAALGGPADFLERADAYLPRSAVIAPVYAADVGYLAQVDARAVGNAVIELGGGRRRADDRLDLAVGFSDLAGIGGRIDKGRPLGTVHAASDAAAQRAAGQLRDACRLAATPPPTRPVIYATVTGKLDSPG